jgi:hypothetical protein
MRGFNVLWVEGGRRYRCVLWSFHSTGNGNIRSFNVSLAGCLPARIASTISGASNASRTTRLTNDPPIFSALAISSRHP